MDFSKDLIIWYQENKRIFPWRLDKDPYHVWISEIMLQQTRIEAVIDYYHRFMKKLPSVFELASIEEEELLKLWQGLGYYNRARNLKKAAIMIVEKYDGRFPNKYDELVSLPGIGEYTAGAISSICFSLPVPAVDGNVLRVLSRIYSISKNIDDLKVRNEIKKFLKCNMPEDSGDFNEGLMELGETICIPNGLPLCSKCPIRAYCSSYRNGTQLDFPIKGLKKSKKEINYTIFAFVYKNKAAILKREEGLLKNLYEFPNKEGRYSKKQISDAYSAKRMKKLNSYKHVFTHVIWNMSGYIIEVENKDQDYLWVTLEEIEEKYPIPTAFKPVFLNLKEYMNENT